MPDPLCTVSRKIIISPPCPILYWLSCLVKQRGVCRKEILMCPCPLLRSKMPCSASSHTFISTKTLGQNRACSQQALSSPCSKICPHLLPLINTFYQAYNNTAQYQGVAPLTFLIKQQVFFSSPTKRLFSKEDSDLLPARLNINHVSCNQYSWRNTTTNNWSIFSP